MIGARPRGRGYRPEEDLRRELERGHGRDPAAAYGDEKLGNERNDGIRRLALVEFLTLDGVMQGFGAPDRITRAALSTVAGAPPI